MEVDILAQSGRENADPRAGFDLTAVVADVSDAGLWVLSDPVGTGGVRAVVEPGSRDRNRKLVQAVLFQCITGHHVFLTHRVVHHHWRDGVGESILPLLVHLFGAIAPHAEKIDGFASG